MALTATGATGNVILNSAVSSGTGMITVTAGLNITLNSAAQISTAAPGTIALNGGINTTITLNQGQLNAPAGATLTGLDNGDTFNIGLPTTTPAGTTPLTITGGGPTSPVNVITSFPNQAITLTSTGSVLNLTDTSFTINTYALSGTTFQVTAPSSIPTGLITYGTLSTVVFNTGTGINTINVASTAAASNTTIDAMGPRTPSRSRAPGPTATTSSTA